jgi:hypothetical protein
LAKSKKFSYKEFQTSLISHPSTKYKMKRNGYSSIFLFLASVSKFVSKHTIVSWILTLVAKIMDFTTNYNFDEVKSRVLFVLLEVPPRHNPLPFLMVVLKNKNKNTDGSLAFQTIYRPTDVFLTMILLLTSVRGGV